MTDDFVERLARQVHEIDRPARNGALCPWEEQNRIAKASMMDAARRHLDSLAGKVAS